ncbi:MAG: hypothetical protein Roseis2KO_38470 [Roseivirga sp.]
MNRFIYSLGLITFCILLGAAGCSKKTIPQKSTDEIIDYTDDLSAYRPSVPALEQGASEVNDIIQNDSLKSAHDISGKLNVLLDTIRQRNFDSGELAGYTILVYSGTNETEAGRIRNRLYDIVPDLEARVRYSLPTYFVKIGRFYQQVEAQPLYLEIRKHYPDATIVPDKFPIE